MTTSETLDEKNERGRDSWINHGLFKAFVAGLILGIGLTLSFQFRDNFMIQSESMAKQAVIDLGVPIFGVYLVSSGVKNFLKRYGFEGFLSERLTLLKLAVAMPGCIAGVFIVAIPIVGLPILYQMVGDGRFASLLVLLFIGISALSALRRRVSQRKRLI